MENGALTGGGGGEGGLRGDCDKKIVAVGVEEKRFGPRGGEGRWSPLSRPYPPPPCRAHVMGTPDGPTGEGGGDPEVPQHM